MEKESYSLEPVSSQRVPEQIYHQIRAMIMAGELKPGDPIPIESELIRMFQRSRPSIREAMRMLENAGLVKLNPGGKQSVVTEPSIDVISEPIAAMVAVKGITMLDLLEYREVNDLAVVEWAAKRRTEEDLQLLLESLRQLKEAVPDSKKFINESMHFLHLLTCCTHNEFVILIDQITKQLVPNVLEEAFSTEGNGNPRASMEQILLLYQQIYTCVKDKDVAGAIAVQQAHLDSIRKNETQRGTFSL